MTNSKQHNRFRAPLVLFSLRGLICMLCVFMAFILFRIIIGFESFHPDLHLALPGQEIRNFHYYRAIALFAIVMLGFWGSLLGHEKSLDVFLLLGWICMIIVEVFNCFDQYQHPIEHSETKLDVEKRLRGMEPQYQWFNRTANAPPLGEEATRAWDALQTSLLCCGLNNSQDWDSFRPKTVAQHVYPASCCMSDREYSKDPIGTMNSLCFGPGISPNFHLRGCLEAFELFKPTFPQYYEFVIFALFGAFICILFYPSREEYPPSESRPPADLSEKADQSQTQKTSDFLRSKS